MPLVRKLVGGLADLRDCAILQIMKLFCGELRALSCILKVAAHKNNATSIFLWSILP